jgi:hypothetical protein
MGFFYSGKQRIPPKKSLKNRCKEFGADETKRVTKRAADDDDRENE